MFLLGVSDNCAAKLKDIAHISTKPKVYIDTYFDSSCSNVAIMRQTSSEGWAIVESKGFLALGVLELLVESVNVCPELEHFLLLSWEVGPVGNLKEKYVSAKRAFKRSKLIESEP